jgi:hypothetical protein
MRCVPVRDALSPITRVDARDVGGLGAAGIVDALFDDMLIILTANGILDRILCFVCSEPRTASVPTALAKEKVQRFKCHE